ncbi:hypothetical protein PFISCL1PPCAC_17475, partial [Pristionchus fissidentatus]
TMADEASCSRMKCLICATPVSTMYYGIEACRACANFFKRAKLLGKALACRQGDYKCVIVKDEKHICRRCRFDRCTAAGMIYTKVNRKRTLVEVIPDVIPKVEQVAEDPNQLTFLQRIEREYNASLERRKEKELLWLRDCTDFKLAPHPTMKIYLSNYANYAQLSYITIDETRIFYERTFPTIAQLSDNEQEHLFKSFFLKFAIIENIYRTRSIWGEFKQYIMLTVESCVDITDGNLFVEEGQGGVNREALVSSLNTLHEAQYEILVPAMLRAQITIKEFHAMLALVLCEIEGSCDISDHALSVVDDIQAEILNDLQQYYKEDVGLDDFSTRLGNLTTLNHAIRECYTTIATSIRMQTMLFDFYATDDIMMQFFT